MNIASLDCQPPHTLALHATQFTAPDGATIIRLVPETLLEAETLALQSVGCRRADDQVVGYASAQKVGFPTWSILSDPANAYYVRNLATRLQLVEQQAREHPQATQKKLVELAMEFAHSMPHLIPIFLEEVVRIYVRINQAPIASQFFNLAREIERKFDVEVDLRRHAAMFQEFTRMGMIGVKEFTTEARKAAKRLSPQEAYDYFFDLCVDRCRAGGLAYSRMASDLRRLAKAAGISAKESDRRLVTNILGLAGFYQAATGFFRDIRPTLVQLLRDNPQWHDKLLLAKPKKLTIEEYFELLRETSAYDGLVADKARLATWLVRIIRHEYSRDNYNYWRSQQLIDAVAHAGDALKGKTLPLNERGMDIDLIDALSAGGITWDLGDTKSRYFNWRSWARPSAGEYRRDLAGIINHPQLGDFMAKTIPLSDIRILKQPLLATEPGRQLLSRSLQYQADRRKSVIGYPNVWKHFYHQVLEELAHAQLGHINPTAVEQIFSYDPVAELQARLHLGFFQELAWPLLEQELERLLNESSQTYHRLEFHETYPAVILRVDGIVEAIDRDRIIAHGTIPHDCYLTSAHLVGDKIAVSYCAYNDEKYAYWLGQKPRIVNSDYFSSEMHYTIPIMNSDTGTESRLTSDGLLTYPHVPKKFGGPVIGTGPYYLFKGRNIREWPNGKTYETNAILQEEGIPGIDLTGLLPMTPPADYHFRLWCSAIVPTCLTTTESLCGTLHDQHINIVFQPRCCECGDFHDGPSWLCTPLGQFQSQYNLLGAIKRPGGGVWLIGDKATDRVIIDPETDQIIGRDETTYYKTTDYLEKLPLSAYHQLQPRNLDMSIRLRRATREQAAAILANPAPDVIEQTFGSDPVLVADILRATVQVNDQAARAAQVRPTPETVQDQT
ncbi:hypothetical protein [Corynebacterium matruchotii]|uniref:Uncharacterized protein n=1 Tax=Corynebacterium matruchotii ATCC 33806 TaxID=566549 RepID=C0E6Y7_9CORY|nr:hypothetical protein [Corynebacterium matruchotii]EEG25848.1 hypothetical protein CORMATOL_02776 [Corynebacterium matruchotii ATCC 33806]